MTTTDGPATDDSESGVDLEGVVRKVVDDNVYMVLGTRWRRVVAYPPARKNSTKPNSASASVNAMPKNIVVRTMPAASGCRAIAVIAFPMTYPIPMAGPIAASP